MGPYLFSVLSPVLITGDDAITGIAGRTCRRYRVRNTQMFAATVVRGRRTAAVCKTETYALINAILATRNRARVRRLLILI